MAFYEGIDEEIYEGGDHYVPMQQFRLNNFVPNINTTTPTSTTYGMSTLPAAPIIRNDPTFRGGGLHGNLDLSNTKNFTKNVWSEFAPGKFGWKEKEVEGFYNPTTNQYQTIEGKNINHLGLFKGDPEYGDIEGEFTGFPGIIGLVTQGIKRAKDYYAQKKIEKERDLQAEIDRHNQEAAVAARVAKGHSLSDIGKEMYTGPGQAFEAGNIGKDSFTGGQVKDDVGGVPGGKYGSPRKDGGRVGLNLGGLASILGRVGLMYGGNPNEERSHSLAGTHVGENAARADGPDNKDRKKLTISPVIDTKWTDLGFEYPTGVFGFNALTPFGKLKATANLKNYVTGDDVDPTLDYQGNIGPVDINATYSDDVQNINATINNNNWNAGINYDAITGEPTFGINYSKTFKHGGLARLL